MTRHARWTGCQNGESGGSGWSGNGDGRHWANGGRGAGWGPDSDWSAGWAGWSQRGRAGERKWEDAARGAWQSAAEGWRGGDEDEVGEPWYVDAHDLVFQPGGDGGHQFTLVLLHSCSGGPDDWMPIIHRLRLPFRNNVRVVVPCAPVRREDHGGWSGEQNSWFEYAEDGQRAKYPEQLEEQRARLQRLLAEERARLPDGDGRRLVLGGLSQGVALAVDVALRAPFSVGGVLALRGMVLSDSLDSLPRRSGRCFRVFAYHGERDNQCPVDEAREGYELLRPHGASLQFVSDPQLGHACARGRQRLCGAEMRRVSAFLQELWSPL